MLRLEVVTPNATLLDIKVKSVTLPAEEGEIQVLPGHVPFIANLTSGVATYETEQGSGKLAIHYGVLQISFEEVIVLAQLGEVAEDIDLERAKEAGKKALSSIESLKNKYDPESERLLKLNENRLKKSLTRQAAA